MTNILKAFKSVKKKHTFTLNKIYRDMLTRMVEPEFLQGPLYKGVSKTLGITNATRTMSFLNFFKACSLMNIKVTITYELEDLDGTKVTYRTNGENLEITEIKAEGKDDEKK